MVRGLGVTAAPSPLIPGKIKRTGLMYNSLGEPRRQDGGRLQGGASLALRWLKLRTFPAGGASLIPDWGTKITHANQSWPTHK